PSVAVIPQNTELVPSIAGAASLRQKNRLQRLLRFSLWGTLFIGLITGVILYFYHVPLTTIIYNTPAAAPLLLQLAPAAPFAYLQFTTVSILHGMGYPLIALLNDLAGVGANLALIYKLTANPAYGIQGALWAYMAGFVITALLDLYSIQKLIKKI
ncbi:MAG: hypothetical protein GX764_03655, partial [Firmicutes bacterium]|nr:hypothetical protein [Bacillota bacterium]